MMSLLSWSGVPCRAHPQGCRIYALKQIMGHTQSSRGSLTGGAGSRPRAHFRLRPGPPFPSSCVSCTGSSSTHTLLHPATYPRSPCPPCCPGCLFVVKLWPRVACACVPVGDIGLSLYLFSVSQRPIPTPLPLCAQSGGRASGPTSLPSPVPCSSGPLALSMPASRSGAPECARDPREEGCPGTVDFGAQSQPVLARLILQDRLSWGLRMDTQAQRWASSRLLRCWLLLPAVLDRASSLHPLVPVWWFRIQMAVVTDSQVNYLFSQISTSPHH